MQMSCAVGIAVVALVLGALVSPPVAAQAAEVLSETPSAEELERNRIFFEEIQPLEKEISGILEQHQRDYNPGRYLPKDPSLLHEYIQQNQQAAAFLNGSGVRSKCDRANALRNQTGRIENSICNGLDRRFEQHDANIRNAQTALSEAAELASQDREEAAEAQRSEAALESLDREIEAASRSADSEKQQVARYLQANEKSLDDFIADSLQSDDELEDFLASSNSGSGDDFLSDSDNGDAGDFLADTTTEDPGSFKIESREDGTSGVTDEHGRTLIPFRPWQVREYRAGLAKVEEEVESYTCPSNSTTHTAFRVGFVDSRGSYIDGTSLRFQRAPEYGNSGFFLTSVKICQERSYEAQQACYREKEARKRRAEQRRREEERKAELLRVKCSNEVTRWKSGLIQREKS